MEEFGSEQRAQPQQVESQQLECLQLAPASQRVPLVQPLQEPKPQVRPERVQPNGAQELQWPQPEQDVAWLPLPMGEQPRQPDEAEHSPHPEPLQQPAWLADAKQWPEEAPQLAEPDGAGEQSCAVQDGRELLVQPAEVQPPRLDDLALQVQEEPPWQQLSLSPDAAGPLLLSSPG
jgi:hypothetical protein